MFIRLRRLKINIEVWQLARRLQKYTARMLKSTAGESVKPVVFFNASTRLTGISQNAAFSMIAAMGMQVAGVPVIYFACHRGMRKCVLGTQLIDLSKRPPCASCIEQSRWLFTHAPIVEFHYKEDDDLEKSIADLNLEGLIDLNYLGVPLGELVLPSIRWVLRRHHLIDNPQTRQLMKDYILSAFNVKCEFEALLDNVVPGCVVVFNGMFFPEAVARWVAQKQGIPVITHEVGLKPLTAFFTYGQATAYPLNIPDSFQLTADQQNRLDAYLENRFQGNFSMAGIRFWKNIQGLDPETKAKISTHKQLVTVFTNVIFDTSQPHSNVVFPHMFSWLELVLEKARQHRDTLFVLRAHPDENRLWKESRENVTDWVRDNKVEQEQNIIFIPPDQSTSSYELIQNSKFIMIYNSTIGLEASILGKPVLCAGRARFTQIQTMYFPQTIENFKTMAEKFLTDEDIDVPGEYQVNARRFLYYQLFMSSLPFDSFMEEDGIWSGFVRVKRLTWRDFHPDNSLPHKIILQGISNGSDFILPEGVESQIS